MTFTSNLHVFRPKMREVVALHYVIGSVSVVWGWRSFAWRRKGTSPSEYGLAGSAGKRWVGGFLSSNPPLSLAISPLWRPACLRTVQTLCYADSLCVSRPTGPGKE